MPYIDYAYYQGIYGADSIPEDEFGTAAQLASDVIDSVTRYRIVEKGGLSALPPLVQELVKKATAAQVSYIGLYGVDAYVSGVAEQGFTVGKVSISGGGDGKASAQSIISPAASMYLSQTGLMGREVPVCSARFRAGYYPIR